MPLAVHLRELQYAAQLPSPVEQLLPLAVHLRELQCAAQLPSPVEQLLPLAVRQTDDRGVLPLAVHLRELQCATQLPSPVEQLLPLAVYLRVPDLDLPSWHIAYSIPHQQTHLTDVEHDVMHWRPVAARLPEQCNGNAFLGLLIYARQVE